LDPIIKLTFGKGGSDNTFVATGMHLRDMESRDYKITGNWSSPLEDGKIPVELKITYRRRWDSTQMRGVFDPEEDSLRGTTQTMFYPGEFVFKRDPDFIRFYPAPSLINAHRRWEFAITSVLDNIHQQAWSPKRILKKIKDGKRFTELAQQSRQRVLSKSEREEVLTLLPSFYEEDVQFYSSLLTAVPDVSKFE
jgi:hypothetical protein